MNQKIERRVYAAEVRAAQEGSRIIEGHGAVFNQRSVDMGFIELIAPGAFDAADMSDVRMLNDHKTYMILARTKSGTLSVELDNTGLLYRGDVADTTYGNDLLVSVRRGDIDQSSFGFIVDFRGDDWSYDNEGKLIRTITKIHSVVDVSPTAFPAYPQTHIDARALDQVRELLNKPMTEARRLDAMVKFHRSVILSGK